MADRNTLSQMLEHLVNDDQQKAEELFHEYVVAKSREIYEGLIESELQEADDEDDDEEVEEDFEEITAEADDDMDLAPGDETDDLAGELGDEGEDEFGNNDLEEKETDELFQDLDEIVDELQTRFEEMSGDEMDDEMGDEMDDEMPMKDSFEDESDLETVREYVEKVGTDWDKNGLRKEGEYSGTGTQSDRPNINSKSIVAGKNDMGGTAKNLNQGQEEAGVMANQGQLKGSSLFKGTPKEDNAGNVNVPGGKAGSAFSKKEPGHGAEKKGEAEGKFSGAGGSAGKTDTQSLFRGRRS
jgi:hypothetical protein